MTSAKSRTLTPFSRWPRQARHQTEGKVNIVFIAIGAAVLLVLIVSIVVAVVLVASNRRDDER